MSNYDVLRMIGVSASGAKCLDKALEDTKDILGISPTITGSVDSAETKSGEWLSIAGDDGTSIGLSKGGGHVTPPKPDDKDFSWNGGNKINRLHDALEPCRRLIFKPSSQPQ